MVETGSAFFLLGKLASFCLLRRLFLCVFNPLHPDGHPILGIDHLLASTKLLVLLHTTSKNLLYKFTNKVCSLIGLLVARRYRYLVQIGNGVLLLGMGCLERIYIIAFALAGMVSRFEEAATSLGLENHTTYRRFLFSGTMGAVFGVSWIMDDGYSSYLHSWWGVSG
jgi:hypothetical protein